ncbi:hypothetical protein [Streptomyces anulatus]|uniref:hypothetical protein n=1 Tax=Streptomyces anulatus TaxID=1892 RepID=UPI002F917221|nr:hypothetical protein OG865_38695 [Streptomyces anulatus]
MNQEEIRSGEEHVASFREALQRFHDDPSEVARIDSIIEDAEIVDQQAPDRNHHQHVIVNVNGGETNNVEIFGSRHEADSETLRDPMPAPAVMPDHPSERSRPVLEVQLTRTRAVTNVAALVLMTTIALFAMQGGSAVLSTVLSVLAASTAGMQILLTSRPKSSALKAPLLSGREARRELDPH